MKSLLPKLSVTTTLFASLLFGASLPAQAVTFAKGDVFGAIGTGRVGQYRGGALVDTLNTTRGGFTTGMAFDSASNLYVTNFSDGSISKFNSSGTLIGTFATGTPSPESLVFDASGNLYLGVASGDLDVRKYNSTGTLLQQFNVATTDRGSDWIDLAADQKTLYYTSEGQTVKRYDVSTGTQLSDFADLGSRPAFALRLLNDGGLLVANSSNIKRLNSTGAITKTYDAAGQDNWFALNLDPDGTSFWSGDSSTGSLFKFDIATGNQLSTIATGSTSLYGVAVFGELTQAQPSTSVPEPFTIVGTLIGATAAFRTRQRLKATNKL